MSGEIPNNAPSGSSEADKWETMAQEAQDEKNQYEAWLKSNPTEQPTVERTGDDLEDAKTAKEIAWHERHKTSIESPDYTQVKHAHEVAKNTVRGVEEAREKYLQNTPEQNYELASKFGKIESAGFDQPIPKARGEQGDYSWRSSMSTREVYPQLKGESDSEYELRLTIIGEESRRQEQGDRLTNANIAKARAFKEWLDADSGTEKSYLAMKRYEKAEEIAKFTEKLHDEGKI